MDENNHIVQQEVEYTNGQINIITTYINGNQIITPVNADNPLNFIQNFINTFNMDNILPINNIINTNDLNNLDDTNNTNNLNNTNHLNNTNDLNNTDNTNDVETLENQFNNSNGLLNLLFNNPFLQPEIIQINNDILNVDTNIQEQPELTLDTVQNEVNDIIENHLIMNVNDFLQNRIIESVTYVLDNMNNIHSDNPANAPLSWRNAEEQSHEELQLQTNEFNNRVIHDIIHNGLHNNYSINELMDNLYFYFVQFTEVDDIIISFRNIVPQIIYQYRRNYNRRNRFFNVILMSLNNLQQNPENNKISDDEFENKFNEFTHKFSDVKQYDIPKDCAVCKCEFEDDEDITILECTKHTKKLHEQENKFSLDYHYFHKECIKEWMTKHHAICPLCKTSYTNNR